ncbi:MAG: hypothetical protein Q8L28_01115 [bacterium]|nr:hypothetical protein [bacterium]
MLKKVAIVLFSLFTIHYSLFTSAVHAVDEAIICPQPYGGGVVCGVKTHEPVDAGIGENMALFGTLALSASGILLYLAKKSRLAA